jgi:hypothetical protein
MLVTYLTAAGWPGHSGDLSSTLSRLAPFAPLFVLNLDIGDTVEPRIGLEVRHPGPVPTDDIASWQTCLDYLIHADLCVPRKRDAALNCPSRTSNHHGRTLDHTDISDPWVSRAAVRWLRKLQISYQPGRLLEAVAYLSASHREPYGHQGEDAQQTPLSGLLPARHSCDSGQ